MNSRRGCEIMRPRGWRRRENVRGAGVGVADALRGIGDRAGKGAGAALGAGAEEAARPSVGLPSVLAFGAWRGGNRHRGPPRGGAPATPPGVRVRTGRFEWLRS